MEKIFKILMTSIYSFIVYFLLTLTSFNISAINTEEILVGIIISILIGIITHNIFISYDPFWIFKNFRFINLIKYILIYPYFLLKANIKVAKKSLNPKLHVNPAIVAIDTELKSDYGLALLSNSITLTPGTITLDVYEYKGSNKLFVHCLDIDEAEKKEATMIIAGDFEKRIKKVFN